MLDNKSFKVARANRSFLFKYNTFSPKEKHVPLHRFKALHHGYMDRLPYKGEVHAHQGLNGNKGMIHIKLSDSMKALQLLQSLEELQRGLSYYFQRNGYKGVQVQPVCYLNGKQVHPSIIGAICFSDRCIHLARRNNPVYTNFKILADCIEDIYNERLVDSRKGIELLMRTSPWILPNKRTLIQFSQKHPEASRKLLQNYPSIINLPYD